MTQAKYGNSSRLEGKNPTEDIMQRQSVRVRDIARENPVTVFFFFF